MLHADDLIPLASSRVGAAKTQQVLAKWAYSYKTCPHVSSDKSVFIVFSKTLDPLGLAALPPLLLELVGKEPYP